MPLNDPYEPQPFRPSADYKPEAPPTIVYTTEIRERGTSAAWWVGGLVAVVAILSATFLVTRNPNTDQQVAAAAAQSRLQAAVESSQSTLTDTQDAVRQAAQSAAISGAAANHAAVAADQAGQGAASANDAAVNASARVSAPAEVADSAAQ
jgi:hypothetical protein